MKILKNLYVQVLIGIFLGGLAGAFYPDFATQFKPFADIFIKLVKMLIAPIIFLTLVSGIAAMKDMKLVGKIGGASLIYFMITTTCALTIGLIVVNVLHPGSGMNIDPKSLDINAASSYIGGAHQMKSIPDFIMNIVPSTFVGAFVHGEILQVLLVAIFFASALLMIGEKAEPILNGIETLSQVFFKIVHMVMKYAPIAAFAAMAFTIGKYGTHSILGLISLILTFYLTCFVFVIGILGFILHFYCKINVFKLLKYIKEEIFIVIATSSSESALPSLMEKLSKLGCKRSIVGLVVPTGYSFNLDGTSIYLTMAAIFIAQATNIDLTIYQQIMLLGLMIISSKGAAGVTGSGFIILASSLAAVGHVPVAGIVIILGVDRFMSEGRAITNMIGNSIATLIISKWQNGLDYEQVNHNLNPYQEKPNQPKSIQLN